MYSPCWASGSPPSGAVTTAATAAGPGLPRAPPSTWTMTLSTGSARLGGGLDRREGAGHPLQAAIARLATVVWALDLARAPIRTLAPVDDDLHVGVVLVVVDELVVELGGQGLRHDAVDHRSPETTPAPRCPSSLANAFHSRSASSSSSISWPLPSRLTGSRSSPRSMR